MKPLERAKARTLKEIGSVVRSLMWADRYESHNPTVSSWRLERVVRKYAGDSESLRAECEAFVAWGTSDQEALQVYLAKRSPSMAAEVALRAGRRLCPAAEKFIKEKASSRPKLLEYCGEFGIVLDESTGVTLKASFDQEAWREKDYIKKIEHNKKRTREFLEQLVATGQLDSGITVGELIETL